MHSVANSGAHSSMHSLDFEEHLTFDRRLERKERFARDDSASTEAVPRGARIAGLAHS